MSDSLLNIVLKNVRMVDEDRLNSYLNEYLEYLQKLDEYFEVTGKLLRLSGRHDAYVFGDIHGDLITLISFLQKIDVENILKEEGNYLIFLGDYIDRGVYQFETIIFLFLLQLMYKEKVILLRGNHEPPEWLIPYPHDFPYHLRARYPGRWREFYNIFSRIFDNLPLSALCEDNVYFVHGGFSVKELDVDKYADPDREVLTELLWNDPMDEYGVRPSYRGVGYLFGSDITSKFLAENGLNIIVRGHEPCNGYWWRHNNKILTLFSRVGEPYYNRNASIAKMRLGSVISYRDVTIISMSRDDIPTL